ncbi:universal stress protein [Clostridium sp. CAG:813]|nr:universal stress protein [Clostridium sp. CAG:813]
MNVLFCTDGSKISYNSIINFSSWVKDFSLDILSVVDWSCLPDSVSIENSEFASQCSTSANVILDYAETYLKEMGLNVAQKIKICGEAVDTILDLVDSGKYDFVVLGSHGKKGIQKWLGSVSQEVASSANISSYISKNINNRKKVLFAVDNSELSAKVVLNSLNFLNLEDKEIYLATVYEVPDYLFLEGNVDSTWILEIEKKQEQASRLLLNSFEKSFIEKGFQVNDKLIFRGVPSQEIINFSNKEDIDLVVTGIRTRKHLSKFLLGSVSKRILENVKSDVLIVHP